jgi:hypothetical protein
VTGTAVQILLVAAALALIAARLRVATGRALALAATALLLLGTFALDLLVRPGLARPSASFVLAALAVLARQRWAEPLRSAVIGTAAGLAAALHWPGAALLLLAWPRPNEGWRAPLLGAGAAALVAAAAHAAGLAAPLTTGSWEPLLTLFGSRQGLLYLTPALWLGVFGLVRHARRAGEEAWPAAAALAAMTAAHAACRTAAGGPCPREEMAPALALLALPMAEALCALRDLSRRAPAAPLWAAGLLLVCRNLLFMQQYADDMIPRDFPLSFSEVARNNASLVARAVGSPLAWPANWLFARTYDTPPDRFDDAAGKALPRGPDGTATLDVGRMDLDAALLLEGWSVRHPCGASVCRAVESQARVLLPIETEEPVALTVRASGAGQMSVAPLDPGRAAPAALLAAEAGDLCFSAEPGRGLRAFRLTVGPATSAPSARALVDSITVAPGACP